MTIKDLIERERNNKGALDKLIERRINNMRIDKTYTAHETLYIYEKHMLEGIFHTLCVLEIITQEEFFQLIDDIENY